MSAKFKMTTSRNLNAKQKSLKNCNLCGVKLGSEKLYYEHCWSLMHHIRCAEHEKDYQHSCIICKQQFNTLTAYGEHLPSLDHKSSQLKFHQAIDKEGKSIQQLIKAEVILSPKIPRSSAKPEKPKIPDKKAATIPPPSQRQDDRESGQNFYRDSYSGYGWNFNRYQQQTNYTHGNYKNYPNNQFPAGPYSLYQYYPPSVLADWYNQGNRGNNHTQQLNKKQHNWQAPNYYGNNGFGANGHFSTRWPYNSWQNNQYYCSNNIPYPAIGGYRSEKPNNEPNFGNYQDDGNYEKSQHIRFEEGYSSHKEKQREPALEQNRRKSNNSPHGSTGKGTPPNKISAFESEKQPVAARLSPADFTFALPESLDSNKKISENVSSPRTSQSPSSVNRKSPRASDNPNEELSSQPPGSPLVFGSPKIPQQQNIEINAENARNLVNLSSCSRKDKLLLDKLLHEYDRVTIKAAMNRMGSNLISLVDKDAAEDVIASLSALGLVNPGSTLDERPPSRIPDNLMGKIEELFQLSINNAQDTNAYDESGNFQTADQNQEPPCTDDLKPPDELEKYQNNLRLQPHSSWVEEMHQPPPDFNALPKKSVKVISPKNAKGKKKAGIKSPASLSSEPPQLCDDSVPLAKTKKSLTEGKKSKKSCNKLTKKNKSTPEKTDLHSLSVSNVNKDEAVRMDIFNVVTEPKTKSSVTKDETSASKPKGKKKTGADKRSPKKKTPNKCSLTVSNVHKDVAVKMDTFTCNPAIEPKTVSSVTRDESSVTEIKGNKKNNADKITPKKNSSKKFSEKKGRTPEKTDSYSEYSSPVVTTTIVDPIPETEKDIPSHAAISHNIPIMNIKMELEETHVEMSPADAMPDTVDEVHIKQEVVEEEIDEDLATPHIASTTTSSDSAMPAASSSENGSVNSSAITLKALNFAIEEENLQREILIIKNQISDMRAVQLKLEKRRKFVRKEWEILMKSLMETQDGRTLASSLKRIISEIPNDPVLAQTSAKPNATPNGSEVSSCTPQPEATPVVNLTSSNSSESSNSSSQSILPKNNKRKRPEKEPKRKSEKDGKKSPTKKQKTKEDQWEVTEIKGEETLASVLPIPPKALPVSGGPLKVRKKTLTFSGHVDKVGFLKVSEAHRNVLYSSSNDGTIRRFKTKSKGDATEMKCTSTFTHRSDKVIAMEVFVDKDKGQKEDSFIVTATSDGVLKKFDINTGKCLITVDTKINITCITIRWDCLFACMEDGTIARHYLSNFRVVDSFPCSSYPITCIATTTEGSYRILCIGSQDKSVTLKEAHSGLFVRSFELEYEYPIKIEVLKDIAYTLGCHNQQCRAIYLHNLLNGDFLQELRNTCNVTCLRVINQQMILVGGKQGVIRLIDSKSQKMKQVYYGGGYKTITALDVHENLLISANDEGLVEACEMIVDQTFECNFGKCPGRFAFYEDAVYHIKQTHSSSSQIKCLATNCNYVFQKDEEDKLTHILSHLKFVREK